ncbi:hypothetical protein R3P38DRAFT_2543460 [Favolaschia claudopus]|uniref:Uncharacterized protein n=1 Tax=Favolaschia claudopus TaxID=2862362 RepID=A0AAW0ARP6_9AGAR
MGLEYCGNAHRVTIGKKTIAVPCFGDPSLTDHYAERDLKSRLMPAPIKGQRRPELTDAASAKLQTQLAQAAASRKRVREEDKENASIPGPVKVKKRRLNADERLALSLQNS